MLLKYASTKTSGASTVADLDDRADGVAAVALAQWFLTGEQAGVSNQSADRVNLRYCRQPSYKRRS